MFYGKIGIIVLSTVYLVIMCIKANNCILGNWYWKQWPIWCLLVYHANNNTLLLYNNNLVIMWISCKWLHFRSLLLKTMDYLVVTLEERWYGGALSGLSRSGQWGQLTTRLPRPAVAKGGLTEPFTAIYSFMLRILHTRLWLHIYMHTRIYTEYNNCIREISNMTKVYKMNLSQRKSKTTDMFSPFDVLTVISNRLNTFTKTTIEGNYGKVIRKK